MTKLHIWGALILSVTILWSPGCSPAPFAPAEYSAQSERAPNRDASRSWMLPSAKASDLLYVSGLCSGVCVLSYPDARYEGEIDDTNPPAWLCSDAGGDVFVPDGSHGQTAEYAHGYFVPKNVLTAKGTSFACAVDPSSGRLAVTLGGAHYPSVAVYAHAAGNARYVADTSLAAMGSCAYDNAGNLFVEGKAQDGTVALDELPKGKSSLVRLRVGNAKLLTFPGAMQWTGDYLTLAGNPGYGKYTIYRFTIVGTLAKVFRQTKLEGTGSLNQFFIQSSTLVGVDGKNLSYWKYPQGGRPSFTLALTSSYGVTLSLAPHRRPPEPRPSHSLR